eukprot:TRINITY_DN73_c0_g1_i1.p1 TRINITY_DN73_c0_g1~~TRINITY_DN73_c0_g1_i1.p1  ORF type:complete len:148 (+),score=10.32 TRINITY_DN73_c0_g1_i1:87-530(+)
MEGISANVYKGFKGYWRRKHYKRLDGPTGRRRKNRVELGTMGSNRKKRFWRIKLTPRLRLFRIGSPKKLFRRLRDAYVNMMLGLSSSRAFGGGFSYGADLGYGFTRPPLKEYDEKAIVEIYKSIMAQGQLVRVEGGGRAGQIVCRSR